MNRALSQALSSAMLYAAGNDRPVLRAVRLEGRRVVASDAYAVLVMHLPAAVIPSINAAVTPEDLKIAKVTGELVPSNSAHDNFNRELDRALRIANADLVIAEGDPATLEGEGIPVREVIRLGKLAASPAFGKGDNRVIRFRLKNPHTKSRFERVAITGSSGVTAWVTYLFQPNGRSIDHDWASV